MDFIVAYTVFALATSLTSLYELVYPIFHTRKAEGFPIENEVLYYFIFLVINTLAAPLVLLSCLVPSWGDRFRRSMSEALFAKDTKI